MSLIQAHVGEFFFGAYPGTESLITKKDMDNFILTKQYHIAFQKNSGASVCLYLQCSRDPIASHHHQYLPLQTFKFLTNLKSERCVVVTSICIFLRTSEVECLGHLGFLLRDLPINIHYLVSHGVIFWG